LQRRTGVAVTTAADFLMRVLAALRATRTAGSVDHCAAGSGRRRIRLVALAPACLLVIVAASSAQDQAWPAYGGAEGGGRYTPLRQIAAENLDRLEVAWTFHTGETGPGDRVSRRLTFEATAIVVGDSLFVSTAYGRVFALDARSGAQRWRFDAHIDPATHYAEAANRGVAVWVDPAAAPGAPGAVCALRIFVGTLDARLIALDGRSGQLCADFNGKGEVALRDPDWPRAMEKGDYGVTSPPAVVGDLVITGSAIGDNRAAAVESGVVRAFDVRSGRQRWAWQPVGQTLSAANAWAPLSADSARDLVFVPTGSAAPDFFGGARRGDNAHANSLVALRASTGEVVWSHQLVHHDLWDYDLPAQPALIELRRNGKAVAAVVQATKMGMVYVFDRETGAPLFEIAERAVPASDVVGEAAAATQPFSALPALSRQSAVQPDDAWGLTFWDRGRCRDQIAQYRSEGIFTPPSLRGTILQPGYGGGSNWGGVAFDPATQTLIANTMNLAMVVALIPRDEFDAQRRAGQYQGWDFARQEGTPYGMRRRVLASPWGLPCIKPPWGQLAAVDLGAGTLRWQIPLGSTRDKAPWPLWFDWGMPNFGGPLVTATGLVFIAATTDNYLRAFETASGKLLWKSRLPAGGQSSAMSYSVDGRQYIVVAAGGHGAMETTRGDHVIAFALKP
jgi:quinoprotein glucose dehydrogenase